MKGFNEVTICNRPYSIVYKGEHYAIRHRSGRVTRVAKADIIKKFHLHHDALDRYIGGGFKKRRCNANEDIVLIKRSKNDVESISFTITSAVVMTCGVALILALVLGYDSAQFFLKFTNELIYYSEELGMYLLGVTHLGTAWSCVMTEWKLEEE